MPRDSLPLGTDGRILLWQEGKAAMTMLSVAGSRSARGVEAVFRTRWAADATRRTSAGFGGRSAQRWSWTGW